MNTRHQLYDLIGYCDLVQALDLLTISRRIRQAALHDLEQGAADLLEAIDDAPDSDLADRLRDLISQAILEFED